MYETWPSEDEKDEKVGKRRGRPRGTGKGRRSGLKQEAAPVTVGARTRWDSSKEVQWEITDLFLRVPLHH